MLKCVIIDDEELARKLIKSYVDKLDFLEFIADFESPLAAMPLLKKERIDVLFLAHPLKTLFDLIGLDVQSNQYFQDDSIFIRKPFMQI